MSFSALPLPHTLNSSLWNMSETITTVPGASAALDFVLAHPIRSVLAGAGLAVVFFLLWAWPYREYTVPYRNLPGPKPTSWFWGNFKEVIKEPILAPQTRWMNQWGNVLRYKTLFGRPRILLADPAGLAYVAQHTYEFHKPSATVFTLEQVLGRGVLTVEGDAHRRQRRILNPAFGPPAIKSMHDIFMDKAHELQRKLTSFLDADDDELFSPSPPKPEDRIAGTKKVDVLKYMGQMTLDVIGAAGFDYDFRALASQSNALADAFASMLIAGDKPGLMYILATLIPPLRIFPNKIKGVIRNVQHNTHRVASSIVDAKKQLVEAELASGEKDEVMGKDLLSRVVRANMDPELRPEQRMSDDEVLAQVATFMVAGHETTSTALTWCFLRLSQHPEVQKKLIAEVRAFPSDRPSFDELAALPYLDKVVHEALRYDSPVPGGVRVASKCHVIPLSKPVKGLDGKMMDSITVTPDTDIFIPVTNVNRSPEIWGPDAETFNPDRYDVSGIPLQQLPGVYGNLLTFFGGARNCIGYRLSLAEMKAALFAVFRHIEVLPLPSNPTIIPRAQIVVRTIVDGEEEVGYQMPLLIRAIADDA